MKENFFEEVELYLSGEMTGEEKKQFEKMIAGNADLKIMFDSYAAINTQMPLYKKQEAGEDDFKNKTGLLRQKYFNEPDIEYNNAEETNQPLPQIPRAKTKIISFWQWAAVAASVVGIVVISAMLFLNRSSNDKNTSVAKKETTGNEQQNIQNDTAAKELLPENSIAEKDNSTLQKKEQAAVNKKQQQQWYKENFTVDAAPQQANTVLADAFYYYNDGRYSEAMKAIKEAGNEPLVRGRIDTMYNEFYKSYYIAQCYMATNATARAIPELEKALAQSPGKEYSNKTEWYLALAYLNENNILKAKTLLQKIVADDENSEYGTRSAQLLKLVDK